MNNGEGDMHRLVQKLLIFTLLVLVAGSWGASDDRSWGRAMSNPILWKYFSRLAVGARSAFNLGQNRMELRGLVTHSSVVEPRLTVGLERRTRHLIRSFLQRVEVQTELLRLNTERLIFFTEENTSYRGGSVKEFRGCLIGLEKASDKLRKLLNTVFMGLNRNVKVDRHEAPAVKSSVDFHRALEILGREASSAERKVQDYVFGRNNVVSIEQLKGSNMLVSLERVRNIARHLKKEFQDYPTWKE